MKSLILTMTMISSLFISVAGYSQPCKKKSSRRSSSSKFFSNSGSNSSESLIDFLFSLGKDASNRPRRIPRPMVRTERNEAFFGGNTFFAFNPQARDFNYSSIFYGFMRSFSDSSKWSMGGQISLGGFDKNIVDRLKDEYDQFVTGFYQLQLDIKLKYELVRIPHFSVFLGANGGILSINTRSAHIDTEEDCDLRKAPLILNQHRHIKPTYSIDLGFQLYDTIYDRLNLIVSLANPGNIRYVSRETGVINTHETVKYNIKSVATKMLGLQLGYSYYF